MVQYSFSLENFEIFILILVRVSCFVYIAPFYGMSNVPNQVKIGLSAMIALLVSGFADVSQVEYTKQDTRTSIKIKISKFSNENEYCTICQTYPR